MFPSVVGRPVVRTEGTRGTGAQTALPDVVVGQEAVEQRAQLDLSYPMEKGVIRNWEDMQRVWDYTFRDRLGLTDFGAAKVLLTEAPLNPVRNRERMCEAMFETFGFGHAYVAVQAVLTLYAQGLQTGVVVDSGDGVTHIVPVYEGYTMAKHVQRLDVAGRDVTRQLIKLLFLRGYALNRTADFDTARCIKERLCYVGHDPAAEQRLALDTTVLTERYTLPDGRVLCLGPERFEAPEVLFRPHLVDCESPGLSELLFGTIQAAPLDVRPELWRHIVLSGGSSMYPGLPSRLERDLRALYLERVLQGDATRLGKFKLRIEDPPKRKHAVFVGGAVLADLMRDSDAFWVSRAEWLEQGTRALAKLGGR